MSCKTNKHTQGKLFISTDNFVLCVCCNRRCENQLPLTEVVLLCHLMAELKTERSAGFGYVADFFGFFFFPMTFVTFYRNKQMKTSPPIKNKKEKKKCSTLTSAWKPPLTFSHLLFYRSGTKWGVFWVCSFHDSLLSSKWTSQSKSELEAVSLFCSSSYTDCILYWV